MLLCLETDGVSFARGKAPLSLKLRLAGGGAPGGLPGAPVLSWAVLPAPGGVVPFLAGTTKEVKAAEKGPREQGRAGSFPSNLPGATPLPSHWPEVSLEGYTPPIPLARS